MSPTESMSDAIPGEPAAQKGPLLPRVAALAAGLLVLGVSTTSTLGFVLLAPAGMFIAARVQRARSRSLTRWYSWIAAATACAIGLVAAAAIAFAVTQRDIWRQSLAATDCISAANANQPLPAWVERLAPGTSKQMQLQKPTPASPVAKGLVMAWGAMLVAMMGGAMLGTFGWIGGMCLGFYATGRWPFGVTPVGSE
jgi:hypothetical protein